MCITSGSASLAQTLIYCGLAVKHGEPAHVLGYQNAPTNLADGPNCMLLHIPAREPMTPENVVDTSDCTHVLDDLAQAARPRGSRGSGGSARSIL